MAGATFSPGALRGEIRVPGDKSISHRALMIGALCAEPTTIEHLNPGRDVAATAAALRALGARVLFENGTTSVCAGALHSPAAPLDCMNSGTTARLMMGVVAGAGLTAAFDGDASLRRRPMEPVAAQLRAFGARVETARGTMPVVVTGARSPQTRAFILVSPSAQVKSALLLCAAYAGIPITMSGDRGSRDHTERMLAAFGAAVEFDGQSLAFEPQPLRPQVLAVPGDPSAAAFFIVAATIVPGSDLLVRDVGVNPTRMGLLDILQRMGARIELHNPRQRHGEPVADVRVRSAQLHAVSVGKDDALRAIDEIPVLCVAAAHAVGTTAIAGISELRVKESDRVQAIERLLAAAGVGVEVEPNGMRVHGGSVHRAAGRIETAGDHRTAMAAAVLAASIGPIEIDDAAAADVSFPGFAATMAKAQE